jgi:streptogramin lyase
LSGNPEYIASGADGNLWFTVNTSTGSGFVGGRVGRVTTAGTASEFTIFTGSDASAGLTAVLGGIAMGPDGNVWYDVLANDGKAYIGFVSSNGSATNYLFSMTNPRLGGIASGPDGNLWGAIETATTSSGSDTVELVSPAGVISEKVLPTYDGSQGVAAGPAGDVWITEWSRVAVDRITSDGTVTPHFPSSHAIHIVTGADGNIWFTEVGDAIGRSTVNGTIAEFPVLTSSAGVFDITKGPDGNVWFTEASASKIGRITPGGSVTEFEVPASPYGITSGPDGNIWFTEPAAGKVARFLTP